MGRPTVACAICGDTEGGPWGVEHGHMLCEACIDLVRGLRELHRVRFISDRDLTEALVDVLQTQHR